MSSKIFNIRDAVLWAASFLTEKGLVNSRLEAELLLGKVLNRDRVSILAGFEDFMTEDKLLEFFQLVERRAEHFPLQYLTGHQEFMSLPFYVEEGVLIPRADTEILVEAVLSLDIAFKNILDVGTGSGIIAVTMAKYIPKCTITAIDISSGALKLAAKNAEALGVYQRIEFVEADVFEWEPSREYDLIISNPPYIPTWELQLLQQEVQYEPMGALDGGEEGLNFYSRLAELADGFLKPAGFLAVEIGWQQAEQVKEIAEAAYFDEVVVIQDYGGRDRVILCRKGRH